MSVQNYTTTLGSSNQHYHFQILKAHYKYKLATNIMQLRPCQSAQYSVLHGWSWHFRWNNWRTYGCLLPWRKFWEIILKDGIHQLSNVRGPVSSHGCQSAAFMELQVIQVIAKLDEPSHGKQGNKSKQKSSQADSVKHYHKSPLGNKSHQKCYHTADCSEFISTTAPCGILSQWPVHWWVEAAIAKQHHQSNWPNDRHAIQISHFGIARPIQLQISLVLQNTIS